MLDFSEVSINDRALFIKYLTKCSYKASEMNFTNFFMWRKVYGFRYIVLEDHLCVLAVPKIGEPYAYAPIGDFNSDAILNITLKLKEYFDEKGWHFSYKRVEEGKLEVLQNMTNLKFETKEDRDNCDYVYNTPDLIHLRGKKYDGKRNHINKFLKQYTHEYAELVPQNMADCADILERWCNEKICDEGSDFSCEKIANYELLNNFETLECKGAIIYVDGKAQAFTVGEVLNHNTAVIHIEKAITVVNGLYTYINQQFCKRQWPQMEFINREQDLGLEGLRKAKLSYNPATLINKHTVTII